LIIILSEDPAPAFEAMFRILKVKCEVIRREDLSTEHLEFINENWLNSEFRSGFWAFTTERFFYLLDYFERSGIRQAVHIEYDVALFEPPNMLWANIVGKEVELALPMSNSWAVASVVMLNGLQGLRKLCRFFLSDKPPNDMVGLDRFFRSDAVTCLPLPTVPPKLLDVNSPLYGRLAKSYGDFGMIFDAAAIGQYFFGIDPLNSNDDTGENFINEDTSLPLQGSLLTWLDGQFGPSPVISFNDLSYRVANLHIHSKDFKRTLR
jgi:hypothetical protein